MIDPNWSDVPGHHEADLGVEHHASDAHDHSTSHNAGHQDHHDHDSNHQHKDGDAGRCPEPSHDAHHAEVLPADAHALTHSHGPADTSHVSHGHESDHTTPAHPVDHGHHGHYGEEDRTFVTDQAYVQADGGKASAIVGHVEELDASGTLSVVGVKHQLGISAVGDFIHVWVGTDYYRARITDISAEHDRYRAEIPPDLAKTILENTPHEALVRQGVEVGEGVQFTQLAGVPNAILREGTIAGAADTKGEVLMLTGAECGPGASGSPVFDAHGHLVGQVLAYDPAQHLTLVADAEQILSDLKDFAAGRNLEDHASPVHYGEMNTVCDVHR